MSNIPNRAANVISSSGALPPVSGLYSITKAGVAALTLVAPDTDGLLMTIIDEGGFAHTVTVAKVGSPPTAGLNGGAVSIVTFNGTAGSVVELLSRNGSWWTGARTGVAIS